MLRKIIDCESLENFPKKVFDGVCFNKIASLSCTNCSSTITRIHRRFFSEYVPKNYPGLHRRGFPTWFLKDSSLQNFGKGPARYLCHSLSNKRAGLQSIGCNFTEKEVLDKNI